MSVACWLCLLSIPPKVCAISATLPQLALPDVGHVLTYFPGTMTIAVIQLHRGIRLFMFTLSALTSCMQAIATRTLMNWL